MLHPLLRIAVLQYLRRVVLTCFAACTGVFAQSGGADFGLTFSSQEKAFIAQSMAIKMCVDPDWLPFERINENGKHEGIAADLIQTVAQRVGLKIELYPVKNWEQSLAASKAGKCQIMSFLNQSPARDQWLNFTEPLFYDPNVIITREEHPYIGDLKGIAKQTVALPKGTMVEERIRREFPNLTPLLTETEQQAVVLVSEREADMTIRSLIVAAYSIKKEGLFNLKIAGQVPDFTNKLRIGVVKDEPLLRDILNKGVGTITAQDRETISNKHISIQIQQGVDYQLIWKIVVGGALVLILLLMWMKKLQSLNRQLEKVSTTDRLTGLYNRMKLDETLESEIARANRSGQPFSVILMDVDYFKLVNDRHGHQAGDQVLKSFAEVLSIGTRATDFAGRWGGEEFLIICPFTDLTGAQHLAEDLRETIENHQFPIVERKTASFGVACRHKDELARELIARVDVALYAAKRDGRNQVALS